MSEAKKTEEIDIDEESVVVDKDIEDRRRYITERGPFAINANPQLCPVGSTGNVPPKTSTSQRSQKNTVKNLFGRRAVK